MIRDILAEGYSHALDGSQHVAWVQPRGRNAISDGGLHPTYRETRRAIFRPPQGDCCPVNNSAGRYNQMTGASG